MQKTTIKIILVLLLVFVSALIAVPIGILSFYDSNKLKTQLSAWVQESTGRRLSISGDLDLSFFPWLGLEVGGVRLSNAAGFGPQPFAEIGSAQIHVKLLPLLRSELTVDTVMLDGFTLHLAQKADGHTNWQDLITTTAKSTAATGQAPSEQATGAVAPLAGLLIGGLQINNAKLIWNDQSSGQHVEINPIRLQTEEIALERPFAVDLTFTIASKEPPVNIDVNLGSKVKFSLASQRLELLDNKINTRMSGNDIPGGQLNAEIQGDIVTDLKNGTLQLTGFTAQLGDAHLTGQAQGKQLFTEPLFSGTLEAVVANLRAALKRWNVETATADPGVLSFVNIKFGFDARADSFGISKLNAEFDQSKLSGSLKISHFDQPAIVYSLGIDNIDIDRYLPPETAAARASATPAPAVAAATTAVPLPLLRSLNIKGDLAIDRLKIANLRSTATKIKTTAKKGLVRLSPIAAQLYGGRYKGNIVADARGKVLRLSLNEALKNVHAGPLIRDMTGEDLLSGQADVSVKLSLQGVTPEEARKSVTGTARFSFRNGAVKGINIARLIREAKAKLANRPIPPDNEPPETDFTELTGSLQINKGLVSNRDLSMKSPYLRIAGRGRCNLVNEEISYLLDTKIVGTPSGQAGKELAELKGLTIPIRIGGTFSKPSFYPDVKRLLKAKAKKEAQKEIDKTRKKIEQRLNRQLQKLLPH